MTEYVRYVTQEDYDRLLARDTENLNKLIKAQELLSEARIRIRSWGYECKLVKDIDAFLPEQRIYDDSNSV